MMRIQTCAVFLLLLANAQRCHGFSTRVQTQVWRTISVSLKQERVSSTQTEAHTQLDLYSAQFASTTSETAVNNRHSANDWFYNVQSLPRSSVLRDIRNPVMAVLGWSTVVSIFHAFATRHAPRLAASMCVSSVAHSFLVSALGLLLVFRTNSAYQRFYEGRKIWEQILSVSRNLSRLTQLYSNEIGQGRKYRLRNLIAAYPYLLRHHIRSGCLCEEKIIEDGYRLELHEPSIQLVETRHEGDHYCGGTTKPVVIPQTRQCFVDRRNLPWSLLTPGAVEKVARARNRPLWICDRLGREICEIPYGPNFSNRERQHFLNQVEKLTNAIGQCERIHQTAVPLNYARHSLRGLTLWLFTLPFCMVKDLGVMTGPAAAVIAWLLFGVYQIGYSIEDPFQGSLRLSILCDAIRNDVLGDDEDVANGASPYSTETQLWMKDAATNPMAIRPLPGVLLSATMTSLNDTANKSPLFTRADYEQLER